jgi:hypothetical protein
MLSLHHTRVKPFDKEDYSPRVFYCQALHATDSKREGVVFKNLTSPSFCLSLSELFALCNMILALDAVPYRHRPPV